MGKEGWVEDEEVEWECEGVRDRRGEVSILVDRFAKGSPPSAAAAAVARDEAEENWPTLVEDVVVVERS